MATIFPPWPVEVVVLPAEVAADQGEPASVAGGVAVPRQLFGAILARIGRLRLACGSG